MARNAAIEEIGNVANFDCVQHSTARGEFCDTTRYEFVARTITVRRKGSLTFTLMQP